MHRRKKVSVANFKLFGGLSGTIDESCNIFVELNPALIVKIHHVPGLVILELYVSLQFRRQAEMLHRKLGSEERRRGIEIPVFNFDQEVRVGDHRLGEIRLHVRRPRETSSPSTAAARRRASRPVPLSGAAARIVVILVQAETQFFVIIGV